jgi:hypothetical protein
MTDFRAQLAPGWSAVNIGLLVLLFILAWPLALVMVTYIVWGKQLNLDLGQPETLSAFGRRIATAWRAAVESWNQS